MLVQVKKKAEIKNGNNDFYEALNRLAPQKSKHIP